MFKKILYVGAGDDTDSLKVLSSSDFVCIDSLPRNEYGYSYYYRGFYQKDFKQRVIDKLRELSFYQKGDEKKFSDFYSEINVENLDSHLVIFEGEGNSRSVHYYFSTGIPENLYDGNGDLNEDLKKDIYECDTVFIKGHWPGEDIIKYIKKPFHFIGAYLTYFPENKSELEDGKDDNIISYFLRHPEYILSYSYLKKSGEIVAFQTYDEFYREYKIYLQE
jgi:hypothetical protein